jgi:hypothetical protein
MGRYGFKYAAINPGSSFRAVHDSIVNYGGNEKPKIELACHEVCHELTLARRA